MNKIISLLLILCSFSSIAQDSINSPKKAIDHTDFNLWKTIDNVQISNDGSYIAYDVRPKKGDSYLFIYNTATQQLDSIERGSDPVFSGGSGYLAFTIQPGYDTLRTCELKKINKSKWPKDSLGIYLFAADSLIKYPKSLSFQLSEENDWGAFMFRHNKIYTPKKRRPLLKKNREKVYPSKGHALFIYNPVTGVKSEHKNIKNYKLSESGKQVAMTVHRKYKLDSIQLHVFNTTSQQLWTADQQYTSVDKFAWQKDDALAYLRSSDTSKIKGYDLVVFKPISQIEEVIVDSNEAFISSGHTVSIDYTPRFTEDGSILYFGVSELKQQDPRDTLLESEKVKVDVWHHKDKRLQPQQIKELRRDEKRSSLYVYHMSQGRSVQISNDTIRARANLQLKGKYIEGYCNESYVHTYNWVAPRPADYYRINLETGKSNLLAEAIPFGLDLAPSGKTFVYFNKEDQAYYIKDIELGKSTCLTCDASDAIWTRDMNGQPMDAYPMGVQGWNRDESKVYLQSRYDLWEYDFTTNEISNITKGSTDDKIRIRPIYWSYDSVYFEHENIYFRGFNEKTKGTHLYDCTNDGGEWNIMETGYFDESVLGIVRSKNQKRHVFRSMTFQKYPDLYTYTDTIQNLERVSNVNPHQNEYNWGTVELTKWKSYKGVELEGLIYKPENFDPKKSYPMISYFYELNSDNLHRYWAPKPTRAALVYSIAEYVSSGYIVFVPDVRYEPGHPAKSAFDCIESGTDHLLRLYPNIDSTKMALQGQSWGGYQTAQLVTMTKRYAAAMAGAPVTNMFSAYGGIRWGSGLNRQFQYERTQSRIGHTIWARPDLYIENSPQFHLPNVETPLLIMHNDGDGAVPWYQGIELFTGLKRLNKEVWMLNYNDDGHNLRRYANQIDLSIRMRQFFDHYLMDKEAPKWLKEGIPAIKKGKELRY